MLKIRLNRLVELAKHWGGMAGALSLVVVVMQNVFQKSEIATQDRIHQLELTIKEAQNSCQFYESTVEGVNKKFEYINMRVRRLEDGSP